MPRKNNCDILLEKTKGIFRRKRSCYQKTFETEEGKYVLADLYKFCGMNRPSYVENSPDRTAYNEGLKRVGLRIKSILSQDDKDIDELIKASQETNANYHPLTKR